MYGTLTSLLNRITADLPAVVVEMLIIGLCVNWCAGVLHSTRGTRPLRGVLVIMVVATIVVRLFGWERLDLLYSYVLTGLAFMTLVVFQPELRRALIRVGDNPFQRTRGSQSQLITALVKSAGYLSRNRYGALIAVQRDVDLTGWAENGTMINAEVSANLLNSIFYPNSALHDLGVIIRGTRVIAANCQFPSPDSDEVDAALGSRHLAAVGMSYESDALVLIVSEETGVISLADNGRLTRYLTLDDLTTELENRLEKRQLRVASAKAKKTGSRVWRGTRRALVVLPLTMILWYLVDQATAVTSNVDLRMTIRLDDPGRVVDVLDPTAHLVDATLPPTLEVSAAVQGPARTVDQIRSDTLHKPLAVTWVLPQRYTSPTEEYVISPSELTQVLGTLPELNQRGLRVVAVGIKEDLRLSVDELVTRELEVEVVSPEVPVEVLDVEPSVVRVRLRKREVEAQYPEQIRATIEPVRLEGLRPDERKRLTDVPLARRVGDARVISAVPEDVTAEVRVVVGQRRVVRNVVVDLLGSPSVFEQYEVEKVDLNEWRIDVEVAGPASELADLEPSDLNASVRVTTDMLVESTEELRSLEVMINAPPDVRVVQERPPTVRVVLKRRAGASP